MVKCLTQYRLSPGVFWWSCEYSVEFGRVGGKRDGYLKGCVLGGPPDWVCCVPDLEIADVMPSVSTWTLRPVRFPTRGVGWLPEFKWDCGCLDMVEH